MREVEITYLAEQKAPCQVMYKKEDGAEAKALWSAANDTSYCDAKATEFVQKLTSLGWSCD